MTENNLVRHVADVMDPRDEVVHPDHPLSEALARMRESGVRMLPVVDGDEIVGLLRTRDLEGDSDVFHPDVAVRDEMNTEIYYCFAADTLEKAIGVMEKTASDECLVVDEDKRLLGRVTLSALRNAANREHLPPTSSSDGDVAHRSRSRGGRKHGDDPHRVGGFADRPYIRD